eukprot:jgi/Chrzof1/2457/Cz11g16140.t1
MAMSLSHLRSRTIASHSIGTERINRQAVVNLHHRNVCKYHGRRVAQSLSTAARHGPPRLLVVAQAAQIEKVSEEELEAAIASRDKPVVIDFYATWCGPCVLLAQELEKVAKEMGDKVKILKVDVDQNPKISTQLQIQGLPTMIFIGMDQDKPALRTEGLLPAQTIKHILTNEL